MLEHSSPDLIISGLTIILGLIIVPVWLAMGLADYFCHRASKIEHTSGTHESIMHLAQFTSVGIPLIAVLFLRIDAGLLVGLTACVVLHHVIAYIDVRYANATRVVMPIEQMIHSFLEIIPITALLFVSALNFGQIAATVNASGADFALHIRTPALPFTYLASVLTAALLLGLLPYLEELMRCLRARHAARLSQSNPALGVSV